MTGSEGGGMFISMRQFIHKTILFFFYMLTTFCLLACHVNGETGDASHYSVSCNSSGPNGRLGSTVTASGRPLNDVDMTAAHKTLKMGTRVKVVRLDNGKSVVVTITDRGPYVKGRIIDLARGPAKKLGIMKVGVCLVEIVVLD